MPTHGELSVRCMRQTRPDPMPTTALGKFRHAMSYLQCLVLKIGTIDPICGPFVSKVLARLSGLSFRFQELLRRFEAGCLPKPRHRTPEQTASAAKTKAKKTPKPIDPATRLPTRFGWIRHWIQATVFPSSQFEKLMADPQVVALIEAHPAARRILRPLCHMLGIERPTILDTPKRPYKPRGPRVRPEPPPPPQWPDPPPRRMPQWYVDMHRRPDPPPPFRTIPALRHLYVPKPA